MQEDIITDYRQVGLLIVKNLFYSLDTGQESLSPILNWTGSQSSWSNLDFQRDTSKRQVL